MLISLFVALVIIFVLSYYSLGKDFFQPACLITLSFILCVVCAIVMQFKWEYQYHLKTVLIIAFGLLIIYLANLLCYKSKTSVRRRKAYKLLNASANLKVINVSFILLTIIILFQLLTLFLYLLEIIRIVGNVGSISEIMNIFRDETSYGTEVSVSFAVNQMLNVSFAICIVNLYIFINNVLIVGLKKNIRYVIPIILYILSSLTTGGRFSSLIVICAGIVIFNVLYVRKTNHGITLKIILFLVLFIVLALLGFYAVRELIGRTSDFSQNASFVEYIASYLGGSIPLFDMYLCDPVEPSKIFGQESFYAINNTLIELGILDADSYVTHLEFRIWNGISLGNVYTGFRRNYQDFGIIGLMILQFVFSYVMSSAYNRVRNNNNVIELLIFGICAYALFLHGVTDSFYSRVLSLGTLVQIVLVVIVYVVLVKSIKGKIRIPRKRSRLNCK